MFWLLQCAVFSTDGCMFPFQNVYQKQIDLSVHLAIETRTMYLKFLFAIFRVLVIIISTFIFVLLICFWILLYTCSISLNFCDKNNYLTKGHLRCFFYIIMNIHKPIYRYTVFDMSMHFLSLLGYVNKHLMVITQTWSYEVYGLLFVQYARDNEIHVYDAKSI